MCYVLALLMMHVEGGPLQVPFRLQWLQLLIIDDMSDVMSG